MPALGLTDHRTLTGTVEFIQSCQEAETQPILGLEIDLEMDAGRGEPFLKAALIE